MSLTHSQLERLHELADEQVDTMPNAERGEIALDWISSHFVTAMQFDTHLHERAFQRLCAHAQDHKADQAA